LDYVKLAIKNHIEGGENVVIDFNYLSEFETNDKKPLGAKVFLKDVKFKIHNDGTTEVLDWNVDKIYTKQLGMDEKFTEASFAILCRALSIDLTWRQHLILCHLYGSSQLASDILNCFDSDSRYRRLFAPFFLDSRSLLYDEVSFLTARDHGEITKTTGFTEKGMLDMFKYCLAQYNLDKEYEEAKFLHPEFIDLLEEHVINVDKNHHDLKIKLEKIKTKLNDHQIMAIYIYLVSVKHKIFGTSILNILPYLNLKVDNNGSIYKDGLLYTLATAYGTFYNYKAMMKDDFSYLAVDDEEKEALALFRQKNTRS